MDNITLSCMNGFTLRTEGDNLVIATRKSEEIIPISKIQSFTMKEPKGLSYGHIVFKTAQAATAGIGLGLGVVAALGSEKSFFYTKSDMYTARDLKEYITGYESRKSVPSSGSSSGSADELRALKSLLDDGIITQAEFDAKKRQILGL